MFIINAMGNTKDNTENNREKNSDNEITLYNLINKAINNCAFSSENKNFNDEINKQIDLAGNICSSSDYFDNDDNPENELNIIQNTIFNNIHNFVKQFIKKYQFNLQNIKDNPLELKLYKQLNDIFNDFYEKVKITNTIHDIITIKKNTNNTFHEYYKNIGNNFNKEMDKFALSCVTAELYNGNSQELENRINKN